MSADDRQLVWACDLHLSACSNIYGQAPCQANRPPGQECYNTFLTCQDRENYRETEQIVTLTANTMQVVRLPLPERTPPPLELSVDFDLDEAPYIQPPALAHDFDLDEVPYTPPQGGQGAEYKRLTADTTEHTADSSQLTADQTRIAT